MVLRAMKEVYIMIVCTPEYKSIEIYQEAEENYIWFTSGGLERTIDYCNLDLDADNLKNGFFYCLKRKLRGRI